MSFETDLLRGPSALGRLERLQQALQSIRVLQDGDTLIGFRELMPWHRSGGETYLAAAVAEVRSDSGCIDNRAFVAKAIVSWTPDIHGRVMQLCDRYRTLEATGVRVPYIYSSGEGVIYQALIPHNLSPGLLAGRPDLLRELSQLSATLDSLGAQPLNFVRDVMTDLRHLYYVDVGQDLGELTGSPTDCAEARC